MAIEIQGETWTGDPFRTQIFKSECTDTEWERALVAWEVQEPKIEKGQEFQDWLKSAVGNRVGAAT